MICQVVTLKGFMKIIWNFIHEESIGCQSQIKVLWKPTSVLGYHFLAKVKGFLWVAYIHKKYCQNFFEFDNIGE